MFIHPGHSNAQATSYNIMLPVLVLHDKSVPLQSRLLLRTYNLILFTTTFHGIVQPDQCMSVGF